MKFAEHRLEQQAAAIQSQILAIKEKLDFLEETRRLSDQPLMIIAESGSVLPWTDQPLTYAFRHSDAWVYLGSEWISGPLSLDKARLLIESCLASRLKGDQIFDVKKCLGDL